jgi:hypothetical protein
VLIGPPLAGPPGNGLAAQIAKQGMDTQPMTALAGREVALGRLGNAAHPSGEFGQGCPHRKNELHDDVWSTGGEWHRGAVGGR